MNVRRVAIGMDFSEASLAAAKWTVRHFAPDAEAVLVHVLEIPRPPGFLAAALPDAAELERTSRLGAEQRLRELGISLGAERIWPEVRIGRPADEIAAVARERGAELIVVGEHGRSHGIRGLLGSTAEQLTRSAPVPVLLAVNLAEHRPGTLLLPVDESEIMTAALAWGRRLARELDARVVGFYAISPALLGRMRTVTATSREADLEQRLVHDARNWLRRRFQEAGFDPGAMDLEVVIGTPGPEVAAAAERHGADLIVMASRGAGGVGPALIGSTARAVLRSSPCPVLVVNQPER